MVPKTVVTIGIFDGVHLGHRKILEEAVRLAGLSRARAVAVTFNPHPSLVLRKRKNPSLSLISLKHRLKLLRSFGIDKCVVLDFTKKFSRLTPSAFIKDILIKKLNAGWVVVGENFCFGRARHAGVDFLKSKGREFGFLVKEVGTLKYKNTAISSSLIRSSIQKGRLDFAGKLLSGPVTILGTVVKGKRLGRKIGFSTANINPHHEIVPPRGVYAVKVKIDGYKHNGVLNIGRRPTFYGSRKDDKEPTIEVHIFDFSKNIYKKDIEVEFIKKIRPEKKFFSKDALARQIGKDIEKTKTILKNPIKL